MSFLIPFRNWIGKNALYLIFIQLITAIAGSMYFSNVLLFPPCPLCWYQRIALFPIILTVIVGILTKDLKVNRYILPPAIVGGVIAIFHNLLYYGVISETLAPCTTGISCTTKFIEFFGFVSIPLLSLLAFIVIIFLTNEFRLYNKRMNLK